MSRIFFTADTHFNHANIIRFCKRPQLKPGDLDDTGHWVSPEIAHSRAEKMNEMLVHNINERVHPDDNVVSVGDFACRGGDATHHRAPAEIMKDLNGKWTLIAGNHDKQNSVKCLCDFMVMRMAGFKVGVQHRPLADEAAYLDYLERLTRAVDESCEAQWIDGMTEAARRRAWVHAAYCRATLDFMIVGHVHGAWKTKKIAGMWHVNVGVDVHNYRPVTLQEVVGIYQTLG